METTTNIAKKVSVTELVATYEQCERELRHAFAIVNSVELRLNGVFGIEPNGTVRPIRIEVARRTWTDWEDPDECLKALRVSFWRTIVDRLELRRFLSISEYERLSKRVERGEMPEITQRSVNDLFESFVTQMPTLIADAVREVFDWLRPYNSAYKSNDPFVLGKRVVIEHVIDPQWWKHFGKSRVCYDSEQRLNALENVFRSFDGKGQRTRSHNSELSHAIATSASGQTDYFRYRAFRNGNLHLWFRRPDLVAKVNAAAGGKNLRGERR